MHSPDSLELLARYGRVDPTDECVIDAAEMTILAAPDLQPASRPRSVRTRRTLVGAGSVAAAAALVVAGLSLATGTGKTPAPTSQAAKIPGRTVQRPANPGGETVLARLASAVLASPPPAGNATLVIRSQVVNGSTPILGADLYTDSGKYYYAPTESGLPAQVAAGDDQGDGIFAREIAAATYAATGNLTSAAEEMETAPSPSVTAPPPGSTLADNWLWENSLDALVAGSGNPTVRAGVMRLISLMPEVAVVNTTANGEPALQITGTFPNMSCASAEGGGSAGRQKACAKLAGGGVQEQLTIDATTGIPVWFSGGAVGQPPSGQITYKVSRVTLAQVAQGHFVAEPTTATAGA
jgi:hypothetical protein